MVRVSVDAPASRNSQRGSRVSRLFLFTLLLAGVAGGSYMLGRKTTPRSPAERPGGSAAPVQDLRGLGGVIPAAPPAAARPAAPAPPAPGATAPAAPLPGAVQVGTTPPAPAATATSTLPSGERRVQVLLRGSLEQSVAAALPRADRDMAEELTQVVNRILVWNMQVSRDGRPGDKLEVLYEPAPPVAPGVPSAHEPVVHALRYASQKLGRAFAAYRFKADGSPFARYYQPDGTELEERLVDSPIAQYEQVTSLLRDGRRHKGVDFKCPVGSPVTAPFEGVVARRNWHFSANGNCLELVDAKSGRHAIFLHLEAAPKEMQPGRHVKKGEQIAVSGNSGHSTAPHLHYQLESPDGRILDPFAIHATRRAALEGAGKAAFDKERARLEAILGG